MNWPDLTRAPGGRMLPGVGAFFVDERNMSLTVDLYELTMAAGYYESSRSERATFELFVRALPRDRGYLLAAGLEQALFYLENVSFPEDGLAYLRSLPQFAAVGDGFFDYLRDFRFSGEVWAVPEGRVFFAGEPFLRVEAPLIEAQLVETFLLTELSFQTLVATKASRVVLAAGKRSVLDFGSRRAHGPGAGLRAARACYVGGCTGTSNVLAAMSLGIPAAGTMAHSWVMSWASEKESFERYAEVFPESAVLLVDTYDTLEGTERAAEIGPRLKGVRLDSGEIGPLSRRVRERLDARGLREAKIYASGDLNEHRIEDLLRGGARVDAFGVGTEMVTSRDEPALSTVYKLVELAGRPCFKKSTGKATYPGAKQVFRKEREGRFVSDEIGLAGEDLAGEALLVKVMERGRRMTEAPSMEALQERAAGDIIRLPEGVRRLRRPEVYPVRYSHGLEDMRRKAEEGA